MWGIQRLFGTCTSKNMEDSKVTIIFERRKYPGCVTVAKEGRKTPAFRLWYEDNLGMELKHKFLMSYMRSLEKRLRPEAKEDIEKDIPFWEFLDIEFDSTVRPPLDSPVPQTAESKKDTATRQSPSLSVSHGRNGRASILPSSEEPA
jgi:hypothetical protein